MFRGTTPIIKLPITTQLNLQNVNNLYLTFKCVGTETEITFELDDVVLDSEEKFVKVMFAQEQTLSMSSGKVYVQLRLLMNDGSAYASGIVSTTLNDILKDGEIVSAEEV